MVYFMENPNLKWMIWGYPYFRKPPSYNYILLTIYIHHMIVIDHIYPNYGEYKLQYIWLITIITIVINHSYS